MKTNTYPLLLLLLTIQLIINGCRPKEEILEISNVEQRLKDWMFFDTGSYWVYQETTTKYIDSQYVLRSFLYNIEMPIAKTSFIEKTQFAHIDMNTGYYIQLSPPLGSSVIEKIRLNGTSTYLFFKELYVGGDGTGGGGYKKTIDNAYQFGNIKDTLLTFYNSRDYSEKGDSTEYRVLRGVGIIRFKNLTKNEEWKLIKYHINLNKQ